MKNFAVIGAGFGDEGKGMVISSLCQQHPDALVVRFCGGQQAGHHVMLPNGLDHVFSNFGSGTLQGNPTYWSSHCTIDPIGIINELNVLLSKGIHPILFLNEMCPVTTPYEKYFNQRHEKLTNHGSCGVGVGQTIQRQEDHHSIRVMDLLYPSVLKMKIELLKQYYSDAGFASYTSGIDIPQFLDYCLMLVKDGHIKIIQNRPHYNILIFEGSQGLLLDQNYGFFPHVTRANTGTTNVLKHLGFKSDRAERPDINIYLVTRSYQTRHGNGPMTNQGLGRLWNNPHEGQIVGGWQGEFRQSALDLDLLKYAIHSDWLIKQRRDISLVITCMDYGEPFFLTEDGKLLIYAMERDFVIKIEDSLAIKRIFLSRDPFPGLEEFDG